MKPACAEDAFLGKLSNQCCPACDGGQGHIEASVTCNPDSHAALEMSTFNSRTRLALKRTKPTEMLQSPMISLRSSLSQLHGPMTDLLTQN